MSVMLRVRNSGVVCWRRYDVFPLHLRPKIPQSFAVSSVRLSSSVERDTSIRVFKISLLLKGPFVIHLGDRHNF